MEKSIKGARKQGKPRGVRHYLIDLMTILMPQANLLIATKVLEDTMERVENGTTIKCTGNGTIEKGYWET